MRLGGTGEERRRSSGSLPTVPGMTLRGGLVAADQENGGHRPPFGRGTPGTHRDEARTGAGTGALRDREAGRESDRNAPGQGVAGQLAPTRWPLGQGVGGAKAS